METAGGGAGGPCRSEAGAGRTVATFDFDGTLSRRDSLLPFLVFVRGSGAVARAVVAESRRFGRVLRGTGSRDEAKEALLTRLLSGADARELQELGQVFASRLVDRELRLSMRRRLEWHRRAGHRVVIVSASPTIYLESAGRLLGVDTVLATELEVDGHGRLTGRLSGRNCRGQEKARRLQAWLAGSGGRPSGRPQELWAYGDSQGDAEMLALADVAVWAGWRSGITRRRHRGGGR
jgi:phosphatidylglycerophosphatase C